MSPKRSRSPLSPPSSLLIPTTNSDVQSTYSTSSNYATNQPPDLIESSFIPYKRLRKCDCTKHTVSPTAVSTSALAFANSTSTSTSSQLPINNINNHLPTPADLLPSSLHTKLAVNTAANQTSGHLAQSACENASTLSKILMNVVSSLDQSQRTFWCQMMDTLAMRTATGDIKFSIPIAPSLLWPTEEIFSRHSYALTESAAIDVNPTDLCPTCGSLIKQNKVEKRDDVNKVAPGATAREFRWVDDDIDTDETRTSGQRKATAQKPIASFDTYVCEVLDEVGRKEFAKQRFYGGASLDSRWLLRSFGKKLGVEVKHEQEEVQGHGDVVSDDALSDGDAESSYSEVSDVSHK